MGNRVLLKALDEIAKDPNRIAKPFGQVMLAAPDIGPVDFAGLAGVLGDLAESATLYFCATDKALIASRAKHLDTRVGAGCFFMKALDMDNVDCRNASTSVLGHDYYASSAKLQADLKLLVLLGYRAPQRSLSEAKNQQGYTYWIIP